MFSPSHGPSQRLKSRPGQDQLGPGGGQSRPLLCREPHPALGKGRGSRVCLFLWPLGGALVRAGLPLGSPSFPLLPRAPGTFLGPDPGFFPQPLLPTTRPSVSPRGLPSCPLTTPTPRHLAGRGRDPGRFALQFGTHKKLGGSDFKLLAPLASSPQTIDEPQCLGSSPGPSRAPPALPPCQAPSPPPLCPRPRRPRGHTCSAGLAADHTPGSQPLLCRGVVALGSAGSTCWDPFNEGESLGFSVLCAWGLGASQQQPPRSRKRPREPLRGAVPPARPQTRWVGWGAQSSLPGQQSRPQDTSTQPTKTEGRLGSVIPVHTSPPSPQAWNRLGTGREGGIFTSVSHFVAGPGAAGMEAGRRAGRQEAQPHSPERHPAFAGRGGWELGARLCRRPSPPNTGPRALGQT
uniref:Voltage-gated potassium channel subunit beta-2 isoform X1 n=1 Tax=Tursiops truncatus TaxID=9739 RepID=A0A6J3QCM4_TURTR|nr:voltage-gated potassium channel subunit beta-2 isoform X1 [Tursiops truncatus]